MADKIAAILIRGRVGAKQDVKDTLDMLNLKTKNSLVLLENNQVNKGMLEKVKDFVTYGEITNETMKTVEEKRKQKGKTYPLNPPVKGFEKKGIKKPYSKKGALGYRGKDINDLVKRMI